MGGSIVRYLRKHGYAGDVVAVNPSGASVDGAPAVSSLGQIPGPVDLACLAVPADATIAALQECAAARVPAAIVYSAGYAETGPDGLAAQRRLLEAAGGKVRLLGPNTMGIAVPAARVFATFGTALEVDDFVSGPVAFVSQSGALAELALQPEPEYGIGFSHWISVGNEADLGVEDFLAYLATDGSCRVICMFLETIRRPAAFAEGARRARAAGKPVIVLKAGRTEAGSASAASHTGALSGSDASYAAFFDKHHIIRVTDLEDLFIASQGALMAGPSAGRRMGIVSMSGGACSILADACVSAGLEVPVLDERTQSLLRQIVPSYGGVSNPVDVTATGIWQPSLVRSVVSVLLECTSLDAVLVQLSTNADPGAEAMASDLTALWRSAAKPLLVGRIGANALAPNAMEVYAGAGHARLRLAGAAGARGGHIGRVRAAVCLRAATGRFREPVTLPERCPVLALDQRLAAVVRRLSPAGSCTSPVLALRLELATRVTAIPSGACRGEGLVVRIGDPPAVISPHHIGGVAGRSLTSCGVPEVCLACGLQRCTRVSSRP